MTNLERAIAFAKRLINGDKLANKEQVQAAQRFLDDLEDERWEYRAKQADFVINIIEKTMVHVQGEDKNGKPYKDTAVKLQDWQIFVIVNLFGFFIRDTNIRRFNEALIFLPRKQGKTAFTAALTWAKNILDRKSGSKTYIVANSLKQTQESFSFMVYNAERVKDDLDKLRIRDNNQEHSINYVALKRIKKETS